MYRRTSEKWMMLPLLLASLSTLPPVRAQEMTAGVQGSVRDASGATVPGATVEVTSPALIGQKKVQTNSSGEFRFAALPPGRYDLSASAPGFRTFVQHTIDLTAGRLPVIDVRLEVGGVTETVEVSGAAPVVDVTQSKVISTVEKEILDNIPKGRSFQSVIPFAAGARQEPLQGGTSSRGNGYQIDGATDSENVYLIDGVNTTNIQNGGVGKNFQIDFIEEVQIKSSSFEAEYGGALGGVINAIPKRGSNNWHGMLNTYWQTNALNANDACASGMTAAYSSTVCGLRLNPRLPGLNSANRLDGTPEYYLPNKDQRNIVEPGFQVGGPLWRDRVWLFASYQPSIDTTRRTTTFTGANPGPRTLTQTATTHNSYDRLDYRVTNALRLCGY